MLLECLPQEMLLEWREKTLRHEVVAYSPTKNGLEASDFNA
jgi:hypothetical protein